MKHVVRGIFWIAVYLGLVLAPLFALLAGPTPAARGFWTDLSLAVGFAAAAMLAMQFLLTARLRRATAPFGIDIIYYFHRYLAVVAILFALLHPLILLVLSPSLWRTLNPLGGSWSELAGGASLIALVVIAATSLARKQLRIGYAAWRCSHVLLSGLALVLVVLHIDALAYYAAELWKRLFWTMILTSWLGIVLYVRVIKPWRLLSRPWQVTAVEPERGATWTVVLEPVGHAGLRFAPGQFVWMWLERSPFAVVEHPFSIASSPTNPGIVKLTIKERGNFTRTIGKTRPGARAYLEGPHGAFTIDRFAAPSLLFVAGGIGIAPIMSMLRSLADRGDRRPMLLIYGNRDWNRAAFREELEELTQALDLRVVHVIEEPPDDWTGERGYPDQALLERHLPQDRSALECFTCGPTPMTESVERSLHRLGVPITHMHTELFDLV